MRVIDVHAHWYPPEWVALLEREGDANGAKMGRNQRGNVTIAIPGLDGVVPAAIHRHRLRACDAMDKAGVAMHALSLTQPMAFWAPAAFGLRLCQTYNDACAAIHQKHPDRFVGLAMLPMQDQALALQEFDRIAKLPAILGIYMATHINGRNLDDKEFWPIYARCEERGLPILLHPVNPVGAERMRGYHLRNFVGNPTESAIAAASLIFSGALDAFPKLDVVLPHAGGVLPILIGRWDHGATVRPEVKDLKIRRRTICAASTTTPSPTVAQSCSTSPVRSASTAWSPAPTSRPTSFSSTRSGRSKRSPNCRPASAT